MFLNQKLGMYSQHYVLGCFHIVKPAAKQTKEH